MFDQGDCKVNVIVEDQTYTIVFAQYLLNL